MNFKLLLNKDKLENFMTDTVGNPPYWQEHIPKNTFYCEDCPYREKSQVANFFYGYQNSEYCYFLNRGDYSFIKPTLVLWDGCKECGIGEDINEDE